MNDRDQQDEQRAKSGIGRDIRSMRDNGTASLRELREFIGNLKGRRPQEVMGMVAGNGLFHGLLISTVGCVLLLLVFTVIPFLLAEDDPVAKKTTGPAANTQSGQQSGKTQQAKDKKPGQAGATSAAENVTEELGTGETKTSDLGENPLDKKNEDVLDVVK